MTQKNATPPFITFSAKRPVGCGLGVQPADVVRARAALGDVNPKIFTPASGSPEGETTFAVTRSAG